MNPGKLCLFSALGVVAFNIVTSIRIIRELEKRNIKINFLFIRFLIFKYVNMYKKITLEENGRIGPLFYYWIYSINSVIVLAIIGLIFQVT